MTEKRWPHSLPQVLWQFAPPTSSPRFPSTAAARARCLARSPLNRVAVAAHDAGLRRHVVGQIQSQPLRLSLSLALVATFSVSAAKPITNCGRPVLRWAMVERMSGFSVSDNSGVAWPGFFLIFCSPAFATRQSATAAAKMATSAGSALSTALSMSRALSTWMTETPGGSGKLTGPLTSVTSAPARAAAAAMAWPCLPDERLAR